MPYPTRGVSIPFANVYIHSILEWVICGRTDHSCLHSVGNPETGRGAATEEDPVAANQEVVVKEGVEEAAAAGLDAGEDPGLLGRQDWP